MDHKTEDRRMARPISLTLSLLLAPAQAGFIGGLLVYALMVPVIFGESVMTGENEGFVARAEAMSLIAPIIGGLVTYVIGTPFIVAAWAIVHFFTARRMMLLTASFSLAGALFGFLVFGGLVGLVGAEDPLGAILLMIGLILSGAIAGASLGPLISALGYKQI
jgi:uncharacterized membrane protein